MKKFVIDFGGNILAQITMEDDSISVTACIDGYGNAVPVDSIIISEEAQE